MKNQLSTHELRECRLKLPFWENPPPKLVL